MAKAQSTKERIKEYSEKYPEKKWNKQNVQPLKTTLLKEIRAKITVKKEKFHELEFYVVESRVDKSTVPRRTLFAGNFKELKDLARAYRLIAAREVAPKKKSKKKEKDTESDIINV